MELGHPDSQDAGRGKARGTHEETAQTPRRRLAFDVTRTPRAIVIALRGELDVVCADTFKRRFGEATEEPSNHVVIDLRELSFMDSTGLALLLRVHEMARDEGFALWIVSGDHDPATKIMRLTGTTAILPIVPEPPDFGAGQPLPPGRAAQK